VEIFYKYYAGLVSPTSPPIILSVCQDSREEALRGYTLLNGPHSSQRIFIRSDFDTLYFSLEGDVLGANYLNACLSNLAMEAALSLKHMAVDFKAYVKSQEQHLITTRWAVESLLILQSLEKLSIVAGRMNGQREMTDALEFVELGEPGDNDIPNQMLKGSYKCGCCDETHELEFFYAETHERIKSQIEELQHLDRDWKCPVVEGVAVWRRT
jgi:hypothetical protein